MHNLIRQSKKRAKELTIAARTVLPRQYHVGQPVAQLFLGGDVRTTYTLLNFPSFFAPAVSASYRYRLTLHDAAGARCGEQVVDLGPFGSRALTMPGPELGLVTIDIEPRGKLLYSDRHMGSIRPHFFAKYEDVAGRSLGLVHPQTAIGTRPASSLVWTSNAVLETQAVRSVELFQINPCNVPAPTKLMLARATTGEVLEESAAILPPFGARRVCWELSPDEPLVRVQAIGLPSLNAKPLAFLRFLDGTFSAFHC